MPGTHKTTDALFRIGLIIKGVDSVLEVVGGFLLLVPSKLARYILLLSQHELYRHHEALSGKLDRLAENVMEHASTGEAIYLLVHGLAKVILIGAIFQGQKWGYKGLIAVLSFFTLVEMTRAIGAHEIITGILGLFDLIVVGLIFKEYRLRFPSPE